MKLYVASSWRNQYQPNVVGALRQSGHDVYDFRHPPGGDHLGFSWSEVDPNWETWTAEAFVNALAHPVAEAGFSSDFGAMKWADAGVLVLPSGKSSHLEAGYFVGAGKPLVILIDPSVRSEAELMYSMATLIVFDLASLITALDHIESPVYGPFGRPWGQAGD
jgi:hypothetical protein